MDKGFKVKAIWFDGELWLYERSKAYPMTTCKEFSNNRGLFGFNYGPVINGQEYLIDHGDFIVEIDGEYSAMNAKYFKAFYKEIIVT